MNPAATLTGSVLEDEKCLGTCYFMFGDNTAGGGTNRVGFTLSRRHAGSLGLVGR